MSDEEPSDDDFGIDEEGSGKDDTDDVMELDNYSDISSHPEESFSQVSASRRGSDSSTCPSPLVLLTSGPNTPSSSYTGSRNDAASLSSKGANSSPGIAPGSSERASADTASLFGSPSSATHSTLLKATDAFTQLMAVMIGCSPGTPAQPISSPGVPSSAQGPAVLHRPVKSSNRVNKASRGKKRHYAVRYGLSSNDSHGGNDSPAATRLDLIFDSWCECSPRVNKVPGAQFKSFGTRQEARDYLKK